MKLLALVVFVLLLGERARAECNSFDPVAAAAVEALRTGDFTPIAIWVKSPQERELHDAFRQATTVRRLGDDARKLADAYFCETALRLHRASHPLAAESAVVTDAEAMNETITETTIETIVARVRTGLRERLREVTARRLHRRGDVDAGRDYVTSYVDFIHYAKAIYAAAAAQPLRIDERERHEH